MNYFKNLPTISYQGQTVKNLLARAKLSDETKSNDLVFQKHVLDPQDRIDHIAYDYYDSPGYSWLVMFSNNTVDPYYDFNITEREFEEYIKNKYGSLELAQRKIVKFRINWEAIPFRVSPEDFNELGIFKKYFAPILDSDLQVKEYAFRLSKTEVTSNMIVELTLTDQSGTFKLDEELRQSASLYGFVAADQVDDKILVKNVVELGNNFTIGSTVTGVESNATATISTVNVLNRSIPEAELVVWEPVTAYTVEFEANEKKKNIKLLDSRYRDRAESEFKRTMRSR